MINLSLDVHQNALFSQKLVWKSGDGTPISLSGCSALMEVRSTEGLVLELSTTNSRIILGGVTGQIEIKLSKDITKTLPEGSYNYDLMIDFANGDRIKLVEGIFQVQSSVTQG